MISRNLYKKLERLERFEAGARAAITPRFVLVNGRTPGGATGVRGPDGGMVRWNPPAGCQAGELVGGVSCEGMLIVTIESRGGPDAEPTTAMGRDGRLIWLEPPEGYKAGEPIEGPATDKSSCKTVRFHRSGLQALAPVVTCVGRGIVKIDLKGAQSTVFCSPQRFRVLAAGRRFGKTYLALVELLQAAWGPDRLAWYVAPNCRQAKRIAWGPLKEMTREFWASPPNETDLSIQLISGGTIALRGAENYESLRGSGLNFVVLDEYASMAPKAWTEVLRPTLSDKQGGALFIGTPKGLNHFHDLYQNAQDQAQWQSFSFTTGDGGNVTPEEIRSVSIELDKRTYRQEFEASFESQGHGVVYHEFDRKENLQEAKWRAGETLCWSLDFNVSPMSAVICRIEDRTGLQDRRLGRHVRIVQVLDEILLLNSNTREMCETFVSRVRRWGAPPYNVRLYGDATGESRSTAGQSDYEIIRRFFRTETDFKVTYRIKSSNPPVRDRVNAVNAMLCNNEGERRLLVNPCCKQLIRDLERVSWKADSNDNLLPQLDKTNSGLTHVSDALGYLIESEFALRQVGGPKSTVLF